MWLQFTNRGIWLSVLFYITVVSADKADTDRIAFSCIQACGLEMLCSAGGPQGETGEEVANDSRWLAFLQGLKEKGYFQVHVCC